jgi:hypothetical protein
MDHQNGQHHTWGPPYPHHPKQAGSSSFPIDAPIVLHVGAPPFSSSTPRAYRSMGPTHHAADPRAESEMGEGENTGVWVVSGMKLCFVNPHWAPAGWVNSTFHAPHLQHARLYGEATGVSLTKLMFSLGMMNLSMMANAVN